MTGSRRPSRGTVAGAAYLDLQRLARAQGRPTDELHQLYALEGFLARLSASTHSNRLVLKGGVLLAAYDARRPTRDVDLQARSVPNDVQHVVGMVGDIAGLPLDDGLVFDAAGASGQVIRDDDTYSGVRVSLTATLSTARIVLHVDVNIGDPITPPPTTVDLPRLLGGTIRVIGYPLPMVYAEKTITAVQRGTVNTRWRDFADIYVLSGRRAVSGDELQRALAEVAAYRLAEPIPLERALTGYAPLAQTRWAAWRHKQQLDDRLPVDFAELLEAVVDFADPALRGNVATLTWNPATRRWA